MLRSSFSISRVRISASFLVRLVEGAVGLLCLQIAQALDRGADGLVVGEHAAQPAMADIGHAGALSLLLDDLARGTLGADKQDLVLVSCEPLDQVQRFIEGGNSVLEVDDVDLVAGTKDVLVHLGIPVTGLVAKVCACLQQVAHAYLRHNIIPCIWVSPPHIPATNRINRHPGAGVDMCVSLVSPPRQTEIGTAPEKRRALYHNKTVD